MDNYLRLNINSHLVVIGDIHGCYYEFLDMIDQIHARYGEDTLIVSVGDTVDRGDFNIEVVNLCFKLKEKGKFFEVQSNHNLKLYKWLKGKKVKISYGMQKTVSQILSLDEEKRESFRRQYISYYDSLPLYLIINDSAVIVHAGIKDEMIGKTGEEVKDFVIYGQTTGRFTEKGFPERIDWTKNRIVTENSPKIIYGHVVYDEPYINNRCYGIDTGCVLGNKLTGYNPFTDEFIFVPARKKYFSLD